MKKTSMLRNPKLISYDAIKAKINALPLVSDRALACLAYASGGRASEINQIRSEDISKETFDGIEVLVINCPVLRKKDHLKHYTRRLVRMDEAWLVTPILEFAKNKEEMATPLFPMHRATVYKKLRTSLGINPQGFRKLRVSHLVNKFNYNTDQLRKFFGWSSRDFNEVHIDLGLKDLIYNEIEQKSIANLIKHEESFELEFKSSFEWDLRLNKKNDALKFEVLKTIVGFMNTCGGNLVIGYNEENKEVLGLQNDYTLSQNNNKDGFTRKLTEYIEQYIDHSTYFKNMKLYFEKIGEKELLRIQVFEASSPVFIKKGDKLVFFIRKENKTIQINDIQDIAKYCIQKWGNPTNKSIH